jgi:hypothetical protein
MKASQSGQKQITHVLFYPPTKKGCLFSQPYHLIPTIFDYATFFKMPVISKSPLLAIPAVQVMVSTIVS